MFNITGHEPWLLGPPPLRPIVPFGGVDNDWRWLKRGLGPDGAEIGPIAAAAIDMPLSLVGDVITLPRTLYQSLRSPRTAMKLYFDNQTMREEVLSYLSLGMPIGSAQQIMEDSGFKCDGGFFSNGSHLRCIAVYRTHHLFIADQIHVLLYHEDGRLSGIEVDCHSIGP
jgi:hypothetical protein